MTVLHRRNRWLMVVVAVVVVPGLPLYAYLRGLTATGVWVAAAAAAGSAVVIWRQYLSRVEVTPAEVVVANTWTTHRVPIPAIAAADLDHRGVVLRLADGGSIRVSAFTLSTRDPRDARSVLRDEYERLLAALRRAREGHLVGA